MSTVPTQTAGVNVEPVTEVVEPRFLNREASWLAFNDRVLEEAIDPDNPLLERLRFLTIYHTNLDEFFMIRVSGLKQQVRANVDVLSVEGRTPLSQLDLVMETLRPSLVKAQRCLQRDLLPGLAQHSVELTSYSQLNPAARAEWNDWYDRFVHPVLTPLATGPTQPFPFISNLSLNLGMYVRSPSTGEERFARVKVPPTLPRFVLISGNGRTPPLTYLAIEEIIGANLHKLFPGVDVDQAWPFRVTRDADLEIKEDEADDLLQALEVELRRRRFGEAVRLELAAGAPGRIRQFLRRGLGLDESDIYDLDTQLGVQDFAQFLGLDLPELKYAPHVGGTSTSLLDSSDIFSNIADHDVLLHHPFDSFAPVVDFVRQAACDPQVYAIKQTLYRTSGDSPIIDALEEAVENGKQVAAIVELKARFDEENNITWARRLEEAGVHVIYGVPGLKTHAKLALVVRNESGLLKRYAHVGTGNYNPTTARVYTDFGLFTADPRITADVADLFNRLTGFAEPASYRRLLVAPRHMKKRLIKLIRAEREVAEEGGEGRIIIKCNAITEPDIIRELYLASGAGVRVDLLIRGICCLLPGVPGMSENIRVRSVVGRFLEHSRVYWFGQGGDPAVFIGSADAMDRNLNARIEVLAPINRPDQKQWLREVVLERYLSDVERTREMDSEGRYHRVRDTEPAGGPDVHQQFMGERSD